MNRNASVTAAQCALSISATVSRSAIAHSDDTDFTGENVRSYPATGVAGGLDMRVMNPASSRAFGARCSIAVNHSTPSSVRNLARTSSGSFAVGLWPCSRFQPA